MGAKFLVRQWYKEQKEKDICKRCETKHPAIIEYHHRDPKEKRYSISEMVYNGFDITAIKKEMEKCDPLCSNCHRIIHYNIDNKIKDVKYNYD